MRKIFATLTLATITIFLSSTSASAIYSGCTKIGSNGPDVIYSGGKPNQVLCGVKGPDLLNAGDGHHEVLRGGRGGDILNTQGCSDGCVADCGLGRRDVAYIDQGQQYRGCERIHYDPPPIGHA